MLHPVKIKIEFPQKRQEKVLTPMEYFGIDYLKTTKQSTKQESQESISQDILKKRYEIGFKPLITRTEEDFKIIEEYETLTTLDQTPIETININIEETIKSENQKIKNAWEKLSTQEQQIYINLSERRKADVLY